MNYAAKRSFFNQQQHFLNLFRKEGTKVSHRELHKFIGSADRTSLRNKHHFQPLQEMMWDLTPRLVVDKFLPINSSMITNTTFIYSTLNLHSNLWINFCAKAVERMLSQSNDFDLGKLDKIYRSYVELNCRDHQWFLKLLRMEIQKRLVKEVKKIEEHELYRDESNFLKNFEFIQKFIRVFLLDEGADVKILDEVFETLDRILKKFLYDSIIFEKRHTFSNSAGVYEMMKAYHIQLPETYGRFLEKLNLRLKNFKKPESGSNTDEQFEMRGESAFQIRFQKNMNINGYWFDRNVQIGINEYDILIKGKFRHYYHPFANLDIEQLRKGEFKVMSEADEKKYQKMTSLWYVDERVKLPEEMIINLNGPYHFIKGDQSGLVRTEAIKPKLLEFYGYRQFKVVDYKVWQAQANNQHATSQFLQKLIGI